MAAPIGVIFSQQGHRARRRCIFTADLTFKPAGTAFTAAITVFGVGTGVNCSPNRLWALYQGVFFSTASFNVQKKAKFANQRR
ncbi:MAG: hypothetical protein KDI79_00820 [Anaerolineae bacterium]|nr:hypothetical protein [Anaerolineae bacterium]